jgi:predicted lipid-binding transport protein (Tim44 family)
MSFRLPPSRMMRVIAAALALVAFSAPMADARPGGGFSTGSRGLKTFTPPPSTKTAPGATQQVQRSAQPAPQATRPGASPVAPVAAKSRFGTGFLGGLLGAGILGALFGSGFFGGMSGLLGMLGTLFQVALIGGLVYLAINYFRNRNQPQSANNYQRTANQEPPRGNLAGSFGGNAAPAEVPGTQPLAIEPGDYTAFERLLSVIQLSFGREDVSALRSATTPEMLGYFTEQLEANANKGVINELGEPKLISGDLAESWREGSGEYATVAMKYSLTDATVDRKTQRVVAGNRTTPQDVTEVWTFTRRAGGGSNAWRLSAIQQVA